MNNEIINTKNIGFALCEIIVRLEILMLILLILVALAIASN